MNKLLLLKILLFLCIVSPSYMATAQIDFFGSNTDNIEDGDDPTFNLNQAGYLTSAVVGGKTMVVVTGYGENGLSVFELTAAGTLTQAGLTPALANITDDGILHLESPYSLSTASVGGTTFLVVAGLDDNGISLFKLTTSGISQAGLITPNIDDDLTVNLDAPTYLITATAGGKTYVIVSGNEGLSVFELTAAGELTQTGIAQANILGTDNPAYNLAGTTFLSSEIISGETFIVAASNTNGGLSVFKLTTNGLSQAGIPAGTANIDDNGTLRLSGVTFLTTAKVGGKTYVVSGSGGEGGLSMFELTATGLSQAGIANANTLDDAIVYLDAVEALTSVTSGGRSFVIAATVSADLGLSAFELTSSGLTQSGLTNANILDDGVLNLDTSYSLISANVGSKTFVIVTGETDNGLSVFEVQNLPVNASAAHHQIPTMPWYGLILMMFGTLSLAFKHSKLIRR